MDGLQKIKASKDRVIYTSFLDNSEKDCLYRFDAHVNLKNIRYLTCHKSKDGNYIWLKGLYVKKKFRKKGIASALIRKAIKKYPKKEIRLRAKPYKDKTINEKKLVKFYEKFGFKVYDKQNRMIKKINS